MKKDSIFLTLNVFAVYFLLLFYSQPLSAQNFDNAGAYMSHINEQHRVIMKDYLSYTSAVANGKSARKVENRRNEQIASVKNGIQKVKAMPAYEGDKSLRDSTVSFLKLMHIVLTEDYGKIVNMEEIAENSYDAMEAYLLAQELANVKMNEGDVRLEATIKNFAEKHKVTLLDGDDKLSKKVAQASKVLRYYNEIYLIFFKSYKQEIYLMEAMKTKNVNSVEQNKNALKQFSEEGIAKLVGFSAFEGDKSLILSCRQMLEFYKSECTDHIPSIADYYLKEENFQKVKKAFEAKKQSEKTQADVDQYNKAVNEMNAGVNKYNAVNNTLNEGRNKFIDNWNKSTKNFLAKHIP
jgi:hypothetical protein